MRNPEVPLKRSLSLQLVIYYGLGNILGAGIYVLVGKIAGHAGFYAPLSFIIASVVAAFTAFSYGELSARYPLSAGEAIYLQRGFNITILSLVVGLLIVLAGIVSAATIVHGFVGYFRVIIRIPGELGMTVLVVILGSVAAWGITESVRTAALFTLFEVFGLLLIIVVATPVALDASARLSVLQEISRPADLQGIFIGAFLAFYAFIGFEDMVNVAEEVRDPERNMPRAILIALGVATILYFAIAFLCILTTPPGELAGSDAPLALVYERVTGDKPVLISIIGLFAVINGALIQIIMASRIFYGLSRQGWIPRVFGRVNPVTQTPLISTLFISFLIIVFALWLPIETLAKSTSFLLFTVFALVNLALWRIKRRQPHPGNIICIPGWIPVAGFLSSLGFVIFQLAVEIG